MPDPCGQRRGRPARGGGAALRFRLGLAVSVVALAGCTEAAVLLPPPPLAAAFDYAMPARFAEPDPAAPEGEYEIYTTGALHPRAWPVTLDACASTGSIVRYDWTIEGRPAGSSTACDAFVYDFPAEGTYPVSLRVEADDGTQATIAKDVVVFDYLIFGVGDSYGSGEGNPDVPLSLTTDAEWQSRRCHRSAFSGQARAARLLEDADPRTSVSFVHLACSGARVDLGLLGGYAGVEPADPLLPPQMDRVRELAAGHAIDALVVSIGGNDVNFSRIVQACILAEDCHLGPTGPDPALQAQATAVCPLAGPLATDCLDYLASLDPTDLDAAALFDDGNDALRGRYDALASEITRGLHMDPGRVFLTEIPDVTHDELGMPCGWDAALLLARKLLNLPGVTRAEMSWASSHVTAGLLATMQDAAGRHGWRLVTGVSARFARRGYCAIDGWLVRLQDSFAIQGDHYGAVHPNVAGHAAYAEAIAAAVAR